MPLDTPDASELHAEVASSRTRIGELEEKVARQEAALASLNADRAFRAAIIEAAAEGVCVCRDIPHHPFVEFSVWNARMVEMTGYTMEEINRLGWYQSMYPDPEVQTHARARMDRMRAGDNLRFEQWEITRSNGEKRLIAISTSVLTAKDGSVHVLGLMHDLSETERLKAEATLARIDMLTGLKNRRGFVESAGLLFSVGARQKQAVTLAYLDVDDLKAVNDSMGHERGDEVLRVVGEALSTAFRSSDVVGRLGGDEFGVALLTDGNPDVELLFERLRHRMCDPSPARDVRVGVSIGVARFSKSIPDVEAALRYADHLMYESKRSGKGKVTYQNVADLEVLSSVARPPFDA